MMRFLQTQEQLDFRKKARIWLADNLPDEWRHVGKAVRPEMKEDVAIHLAWERKLFEHGWVGLHWPKHHGGQGLGLFEHLIFQEELGLSGAPEGLNGMGRELVGPILMKLGTPEQQSRYLRNILAGKEIWCQGFSEPNAGSDLGAMRTRATRVSDGWCIDGQKVWTSYAAHADLCLLLARVAEGQSPRGHIAMFILPMNTKGVQIRPIEQIHAKKEFCEVFLNSVILPEDALIGTVEGGWRGAAEVLGVERGANKLYRQASFVAELRSIQRYKRAHSSVLAPHVSSAFDARIGELYGQLSLVRYRNFALVGAMQRGEQPGHSTSAHKLYWTEVHQDACELGLDVLTAVGHVSGSQDTDVQRLMYAYFSSRAETIFAGTSQIQRDILAQRVLELPRAKA